MTTETKPSEGATRAARRILQADSEIISSPLLTLAAAETPEETLICGYATIIDEETRQDWIPCGERMPEIGRQVNLLTRANPSAWTGKRTKYPGDSDWSWSINGFDLNQPPDSVIGWCPLPPGPEEQR